jgi:hypothetical protein
VDGAGGRGRAEGASGAQASGGTTVFLLSRRGWADVQRGWADARKKTYRLSS